MQERPKEECGEQEASEETNRKDPWADNEEARSYYYDDAHGYEPFDPNRESSDDDEDLEASSSSSEAKR